MTKIYLDPEKSEWDKYVSENDSAVFAHLYSWGETLASTYGLEIFRLTARKEGRHGKIIGSLPLILFSAPNADKRLISLPYTDAAGIIADDEDIFALLLKAALDLAADLDAVHLELRQAGKMAFPHLAPDVVDGIQHSSHTFKVGLSRPLSPTPEMIWADIGSKVRNQVRKARKSGCSIKTGGSELLDDFFSVFSENMRDLGSPVHPFQLFQSVIKKMETKIIVIYAQGIPTAAAMVFLHNSTLFNPWASSLRRFRPVCPNMLLYWAMLSYAAEKRCHVFDFGRSSPGATTYRFKSQWGAETQPLVWHIFSRKPYRWIPENESLVSDSWKTLDLDESRKQGPSVRRWISL